MADIREPMRKRLYQMSQRDRVMLGKMIEQLQAGVPGLSVTNSLEVLYKVGTWLNITDADNLKYSSDGKNQDKSRTSKR